MFLILLAAFVLFFYVVNMWKGFFSKFPLLLIIACGTYILCYNNYMENHKTIFFTPNGFDFHLIKQEIAKCDKDDIDCKYDTFKKKLNKKGLFVHQDYLLAKNNLKTICSMSEKDGFIYGKADKYCSMQIKFPTFEEYKKEYFHNKRKNCQLAPLQKDINECISEIEKEIKEANSSLAEEINKAYDEDMNYLKNLQVSYNALEKKDFRTLATQLFKVDYMDLGNNNVSLYSEQYTEEQNNIEFFNTLYQMLYDSEMYCIYPNNREELTEEQFDKQVFECKNEIINNFANNEGIFKIDNVEEANNLSHEDQKELVRFTIPSLHEASEEYKRLVQILKNDFNEDIYNANSRIQNNHFIQEYTSNGKLKVEKYMDKLYSIKKSL